MDIARIAQLVQASTAEVQAAITNPGASDPAFVAQVQAVLAEGEAAQAAAYAVAVKQAAANPAFNPATVDPAFANAVATVKKAEADAEAKKKGGGS
jgi:hypothetical protein